MSSTIAADAGLSQLHRDVLDFHAHIVPTLPRDGAVWDAARDLLGIDWTRSCQTLTVMLADQPTPLSLAALAYDAPAVARLRRERDRRMDVRGTRGRRLVDAAPARAAA